MIESIIVTLISLISLLIGHSLGKHESAMPPDVRKKVEQIFKRVVPKSEVGAIERPTAQDNYYRDNPKIAQEDELMENTIDILNK